ncbi:MULTISPECIES: beta-1,3-glucanase family protein [unclassified Francisella]|uniref:beta-1,3-glucanase family protein n=1 Tax=unclassified Francisella TaxID=2610885 RepID=UPI002E35CEA2|nr:MULTISPECIES: beta-1,3-glucanase family protein [unclassified Francisella]MED7819357.1 beta-1,3-glucanase family protein [Francisella sp. 19S2-4]MED7830186.1 beta-1,3-glucanase family protein [Francisella sp. 19S2-10]
MKKIPLGLTVAISATLLSSCGSNHKNQTSINSENLQNDYSQSKEQAQVEQTDLAYSLQSSPKTVESKPKATSSNTYPLKIINNSNVSEDTYITVIDGTNIYKVADDGSLKKGPLLSKAYFQDYGKNIGHSGDFTIKLPDPFVSGRIYVSVGYPLGGVATNAPFYSTSSSDSNYYMSQVVYDKFELTWKDSTLYIDPTSVDFFSIPLTMQNPSPIKATDLKESGYPLGMSRKEIIKQATTNFTTGVSSGSVATWKDLIFNNSGSTIRIISPSGIATSTGANNPLGSIKNMVNKPATTGSSYLLDSIKTPSGSSFYLQNLISYYESASKHPLAFDVSQLYSAKYPQTDIFKNVVYIADGISSNSKCSQQINSYDSEGKPIYGAYADSSSCWKFIPKVCSDLSDLSKCKAPTTGDQAKLQNEYIPMDYVSSFDFFSPGQWPFDNNNILPTVYKTVDTIQDNHPAKGLIAEGLSALFSAGLLPVSNSDIEKTAISKSSLNKLVNSNNDILYKDNSANGQLEDKGPWFSQYSKVIHSICYDSATKAGCTTSTSAANRKYPIVYTFAFDDFLAQDGTLTSNTTASGSTISVTINDMQGYPQTTPGKAPRPSISVDTPAVTSGSLETCKTAPADVGTASKTCKLSATFTTKNTPTEIKGYTVNVSPISTDNGSHCQYLTGANGNIWAGCGAVAASDITNSTVTKLSGPSNGVYTYKVTSEVPRDTFEKVVTGAVWQHCTGSTSKNEFKYSVIVSDGKQTIGALSPNSSTFYNISGCASPA